LYIEGDNGNNFRILRAVKNRFGSVNEVGVFEMREDGLIGVKDYSGVFMSSTRGENSGSIVTPSVTGNRCVPVEIQSLVSKTPFGLPRRMSQGIDYNKMILMLAVLEKKAGYAFYNQDVYLNAMSGLKLSEPSIDLAIALSLVSSSLNKPIPKTTACFGEVGLTGEVRGVFQAEMRVKECINMGFERVILPYSNLKAVKKYEKDIKLLPVSYLYQATKLISEDKKD
jgi:DNA repair protein RadA/Sms